jgi:hypothetical protein
LRALLVEHGIADDHETILGEAQPAISLFLSEVVERDERTPPDGYRIGTHRFGGQPDLPVGVTWPAENGEPFTFVLQLALASLPAIPESPLPTHGMLWLFQGGLDDEKGPKARVLWKDCIPSKCVRQRPPTTHSTSFREYAPFGIETIAASDLPPVDSHDRRPMPHGDLPESYFDFVTRARDPHFDRHAASEYPWHWQYVGQLLGVTPPRLPNEGGARWRRLLSLSENPITDFSTLIDAEPLHYVIDAHEKTWTRFDSVMLANTLRR